MNISRAEQPNIRFYTTRSLIVFAFLLKREFMTLLQSFELSVDTILL